jgi:hypothetical protein
VQYSVSLLALSSLLSILQPYHENLAWDARTLLETPTTYQIKNLINDERQYHNFGIRTGIMSCLKQMDDLMSEISSNMQCNIDGLPICKSSYTEFWPTLRMVKQTAAKPSLEVCVAAKKQLTLQIF